MLLCYTFQQNCGFKYHFRFFRHSWRTRMYGPLYTWQQGTKLLAVACNRGYVFLFVVFMFCSNKLVSAASTRRSCFPFSSTPCSLDLETGYPDWGFRGFPQSLQANAGTLFSITPQPCYCTYFSNSSFSNHLFIRCYIVWATEKASLQINNFNTFLFPCE
jgi:hypothetical protein